MDKNKLIESNYNNLWDAYSDETKEESEELNTYYEKKYSDLIIPEEDEILENYNNYELINNEIITFNNISFLTRKQKNIKTRLLKCNDNFLKYLYMELYDEIPDNDYKKRLYLDKNNIEKMNNFLSLIQNKK